MNAINIILARHAESTGNINGRTIIGQPFDTTLTEYGRLQAKKLAERFSDERINFDLVVASSFERAKQTAQVIIDHLKYRKPYWVDSALIEYSPGDWRGTDRRETLSNLDNLRAISSGNMHFKFPGNDGESLMDVQRLASEWLERSIIRNSLVHTIAKDHEANVLVVSHGMTIKCLLHYILGFDSSMIWKIEIENTSLQRLRYDERGWHVLSLNDTGHLR